MAVLRDAVVLPIDMARASVDEVVVVERPVTPVGIVLGVPGAPGPRGPEGPEGPRGPRGPEGPMPELPPQAQIHVQQVPSAVWEVEHSLPFVPNVTVVDSSGAAVEGDVEYLGPQTIRVTFSSAFSGTAYLS